MEARILLIEDTASDAELIQEAFKESHFSYRLDLATDGEEALRILRAQDEKPHLVLLDLNLPKKNGLDVLKDIRRDSDPLLMTVPVVILTNSKSRKDVLRAYTHGCNAYVHKPINFDRLVSILQVTSQFWFDCATVPTTVAVGTQRISSEFPPPSSRRRKK
jgi:two-component system, chemotaxis family, response regulator Rcp1